MIFAEDAENPEKCCPHATEKENAQQGNLPWLSMGARPEVAPVATVGCGEPVILDDDRHEEPEDDLPASEGGVEGWDGARRLAVVVWETEEEDEAGHPHEYSNGNCDDSHDDAVADGANSPGN